MKRATSFVLVVGVLLFSQLALAEVEFQVGEFTVNLLGEVPHEWPADEQLAAAGFKVVPLQAYTVPFLGSEPEAWWQLGEEFYEVVALKVKGSGQYYVKVIVTDLKTGETGKVKLGPYSVSDGFQYWWSGPTKFTGDPPPGELPRKWKMTFIFKVGTINKGISTKFILY